MSKPFKITYSAMNADMGAVHKEFDETYAKLKLELGYDVPSMVAGRAIQSGRTNQKFNPVHTTELIAKYHVVSESELNEAFLASRKAQKSWGATSWQERVRITKKAAELIRERRMKIAALMTLEIGKNRMESLGDAEESAD
ncbi:MAG: aldehyde dehydrogenase family protein, partial [Bdellovibrionales bacterium]|nr:aldehyde dehydrogenase family protein [Oligoflexia bacterium]